jgi:hypothetical protein
MRCHRAILGAYAGLQRQHVAFGLTLILDEIARHMRGRATKAANGRPRQPTV